MGQEIGQWRGKLTVSWEVRWTLLGISSHWITLLWEFLHLPHGLSQIPSTCPSGATLHPSNPAFYPRSLKWMDKSNHSWTLSLTFGWSWWVGNTHRRSKGIRKGSFQSSYIPQPTIIAPFLPQLYGDIIEMWHCVSLRWTTWWFDTHIYISK